MKKLILVICALGLILSIIGCNKAAQTENPEAKVSVSLNHSAKNLDIGESVALVATVYNWEGAVTWTSSNEEVATVSGGLVTAVGMGAATVTASVGTGEQASSAQCAVTVEDSGLFPVLFVDYSNVALEIGQEITVVTKVKLGLDDAAAVIVAESKDEDIAGVEMNAAGNAVITAVDYGETEIEIKCSFSDTELKKTVSVTVKESVRLELTDIVPVGGINKLDMSKADLSATPYKAATRTVEYRVIVNSVDITATANITWSSGDEKVVTVDNGVITAVGVGTTVVKSAFMSSMQVEYSAEITVTVSLTVMQIDNVTADELILEFGRSSGAVSFVPVDERIKSGGEVLDLVIDGDSVFESYNNATGAVVLDRSKITAEGADKYGMRKAHIMTEFVAYEIKLGLCDYKIMTKGDLDGLKTLLMVAEPMFAYWDGYVLLGADIEYNGVFEGVCNMGWGPTGGFVGSNEYVDFEAWNQVRGFRGTFDGNGHYISGVEIPSDVPWQNNGDSLGYRSFFGSIAPEGVVKNVAFINSVVNSTYHGSFLASYSGGLIQDVFVSGEVIGTSSPLPNSLLVCQNWGVIENAITEVTNEPEAVLGMATPSGGSTVYRYVYTVKSPPSGFATSNNANNFDTSAELKANEAVMEIIRDNFNSDIWDFDNYFMPIFKSTAQWASAKHS